MLHRSFRALVFVVVLLCLGLGSVVGCGSETSRDDNSVVEGDAGVDGGDVCVASADEERSCDGIDDDCDGQVDEGLNEYCPLQTGVCAGATVACSEGRFPTCDAEQYGDDYVEQEGPGDCDGLDNDCDGQVDEECECTPDETQECYSGDAETRDVGRCRVGTQTCQSDGTWGECTGETTPADEDTCNNVDDDCDGVVDEGCFCDYQGNSRGVCAGQTRQSDGTCPEPDNFEAPTDNESACDGMDNDCDGEIDEGCECSPGAEKSCYSGSAGTEGVGVCRSGTQTCQSDGTWGDCTGESTPASDEKCNGQDDDCDGVVDEGCFCDYQGNSRGVCAGQTRQSDGTCPEPDSYESPTDTESACDGLDNDCDGEIDEGCECSPGDEQGCYSGSGGTEGVGICQSGTQTCQSDGTWGDCTGEATPASDETCNGQDDDCDGVVDEGCFCDYQGNSRGVCAGQTRQSDGTCPEPDSYESPTDTESSCDGLDNDCDGEVDEGCSVTGALPPTSSRFGWQSTQRRLAWGNGQVCESDLTIRLSDYALCYADRSTDKLKCAGQVHDKDFGTSFSTYGRTGVEQVYLAASYDDMCTLAGTTLECFGGNDQGQLADGSGSSVSSSSPVDWGGRTDIEAFATGTGGQICAGTTGGDIYCAGTDFGSSATMQGTGSTFWVDTFGDLNPSPTDVLAAQPGRAECTVRSSGLECAGTTRGSDVVSGGLTERLPSDSGVGQRVCWLEEDGQVFCENRDTLSGPDRTELFSQIDAVALAISSYSGSRCAVATDGSLWCIGENNNGKFGTGNTNNLTSETQVQPSGSVRFGCQ